MAKNDIDIVVGAQDKASQVLRGVSSQVGSLSTSFASLGPAVVGIGAAIGGAVASFIAIKSGIDGVVSAANRIDALTDVATGLGESVGDLQAFQFALAEAGNVSPDKAISTLQKLSATIGGIASGENKAGAEVLKQLGLDAEQLALDGPIAQFEAIQGKLAEISNASERAAIAQRLFGKEAKDLLPALSVQSESMRESAEYARKVGAAVSEEGAAGVASMNDAVGRLLLGFEGVFNQVAIALAPAVEAIALTLADWLIPVSEMVQNYLPAVVDAFASILDSVIATAAMLGLMSEAEKTYTDRIEESRKAAAERARELQEQREQAAKAGLTKAQPAAEKNDKGQSTIDSLQRELEIAREGLEVVREREQLASASNALEFSRIAVLQLQLNMQNRINEANKTAAERNKRALEEQKKLAQALTPTQDQASATNARLLRFGQGSSVQQKMVALLQQLLNVNNQQLYKLGGILSKPERDFVIEAAGLP